MSTRTTIDFGIHLGITHAEIAVLRGTTADLIKNNEDNERTPCAVFIDKKGQVHVGQRAMNRLHDQAAADDASPVPSVILLTPSREQHVSASRLTALVPQPQPTSTNAQGNSDGRLEPETPRLPPLFSVAGATVSTNNTEVRIIFDEGLFAYRCELTESARTRLDAVGRTIGERAPDCWVIVEGHTDSDPLPPNSAFRDNFTLGLHRALAAVEVLKATAIPPQDIFAASGGDQAPVFPGDGYETKLKNRTVVIRLLPKATGETRTGESRQ